MTPDPPDAAPLLRNISDTARWIAAHRARETRRPDALFRDPLAERLAGERGEAIAKNVEIASRGDWPFVVRTLLFDAAIADEVARGADLIVNLAAGLDTRPYRMALPSSLRWVEVDLPDILDYKEEVLAGERPVCALERLRLDLTGVAARRQLFERLARSANRALVVTEGLLIYLEPADVAGLARDLAAAGPAFARWATDLASPGLVRMMSRSAGAHLERANAPLKFGPAEGPGFFEPHGWRAIAVRSYLKEAARVRRVPWFFRLLAMLPESSGRQGDRPWAACCLLERM